MHGPRRRDVAGLILGGAVLAGTAALARRAVAPAEARIFERANALPDAAFRAIWVPMQYGTFGAVPALAGVALAGRRYALSAAIAAAGTSAWILAKVVKPAVGRGRPLSILAGVRTRGKEEGDLGFPSGHAAVSAALTLVMWPYASLRGRVAGLLLGGLVPLARMYVGAHLPLDVVGGSALGVAVASLTNLVVGSDEP